MPNIKLFITEAAYASQRSRIQPFLETLRQEICRRLSVPLSACQIAALPVLAVEDQPQLNIEINILRQPDRLPEMLRGLGEDLRQMISEALGLTVAVRITSLDKAHYLALK